MFLKFIQSVWWKCCIALCYPAQWHHTASLKSVTVGEFTLWKSENATNQGGPILFWRAGVNFPAHPVSSSVIFLHPKQPLPPSSVKRVFSRTGRCETWLWPSALRRLNDFTWTSRHGRIYKWDRSSKGGRRGRAAPFPFTPTPQPLLHGEQVEKRCSDWGKDTGKKTAWQKLEGLAVSGGSDPGYRIRAKKYRFDLIRRRTSTRAIQRWNEMSPECNFLPSGWGA